MQRFPMTTVVLLLAAGCATPPEPLAPTHPIDAVRKVVDNLSGEIARRQESDPWKGLPVVVRTSSISGTGIEPIVAELLRTRLVERSIAVDAVCGARCLEVALQEFSAEGQRHSGITPGDVLSFAGGQIPIVGGAVRSLSERARESERVAARTSGFIVTLAAREGARYTARANMVAVTSSRESSIVPATK